MATKTNLSEALSRALALTSSHPSVLYIGKLVSEETNGATVVDVSFEVSLPNEWRSRGESPTGVRITEEVRLIFPPEFPLRPPKLSLRPDFNRNLPHIQPWLERGCPVPCIYEGNLAELLHQEGMVGILNQVAWWLDNAAMGTLIDPNQGWEPVRRDTLKDSIVADAGYLQSLVNRKGGHRFLKFTYIRTRTVDNVSSVQGHILSNVVTLNPKTVPKHFHEHQLSGNYRFSNGKALALVVWPGKHPSGEPIICDTYLPETVNNVNWLRERAKIYGCANQLNTGLSWLGKCLSDFRSESALAIAIVLLARRPFNIIGSGSPIELCPYVIDVQMPQLFPGDGATIVHPAAHRDVISRTLLAQMSGSTVAAHRPKWALIGAGSLGSKVALHLARAGNGPAVVVDKSVMAPHNAARHALVPMPDQFQVSWMGDKAWLLSEALRGLNQVATPISRNLVDVLVSKKKERCTWLKRSWVVVNATASLVVREALAQSARISARIIETSLFSNGVAGVITVEGPIRNPDTADLMAEFYLLATKDPELSSIVFTNESSVERQAIGQGCGSLTMPMPDGRLSLFAAGVAEYLRVKQRDGLLDGTGEILIGRLSEDGMSLSWRSFQMDPTIVVKAESGESWCVHIHKRAADKMQHEAKRCRDVETGGLLIGRLSEAARVAHVVDVLEPPEDSLRLREKFVLGVRGLKPQLESFVETSGFTLYCLGTWHSHLCSSGASATDLAMAKAVSATRLIPSIFLILTPLGFRAFTANIDNSVKEKN